MNNSISFVDLIQIYRESQIDIDLGQGNYLIKSSEGLQLLQLLSSDEYFENTNFDILDGDLAIGNTVKIQFGTPKPTFGRFYNNIESFIKGDMANINNQSFNHSPYYYIKSEDIASFDENKSQIIVNYLVIKDFLSKLITMDSYTDNTNRKLIFFSKKTFELSFDISHHITEFINLLSNLHKDDSYELLIDFKKWLNDEKTSSHIDEKKSILAFVLSDALPQNANLLHVIERIKDINESVQAQYALYLENFSYERFVKKLEENSEKFVVKVNDTISKVLPQFLGLPFLTTIPIALKSGDNWLVYLALCIYCIICICALTNQKLVLGYIKEDVDNYEEKGKIPEKLKTQWRDDKERIDRLLNIQKLLYYILLITVSLCLIYGFYKLFPWVILWNYCLDLIEKGGHF